MKRIMVTVAVVLLAACTPSAEQYTPDVQLPAGLKDCQFYMITNSVGAYMKVIRCPNSSTTANYTQGKTTQTTVTIDGVIYERKEGQ